jgi:hypothetical protein
MKKQGFNGIAKKNFRKQREGMFCKRNDAMLTDGR